LHKFVGGIGLGLKLYELYYKQDPLIFSIGPLNGFYPFASKTSVLLNNEGVIEDLYIGGNLSTRIRFCGLDSIVIIGTAKNNLVVDILNTNVKFEKGVPIENLGLPGKRSVLRVFENKALLEDYFQTPHDFLYKTLKNKRVDGVVVTGSEVFSVDKFSDYTVLYNKILSQRDEISIKADTYPSCSNCPRGCQRSIKGEIGGNVLTHCLVTCQFADSIFNNIGIVFSCLNTLGYDYNHEDLENAPSLVEELLKKLS